MRSHFHRSGRAALAPLLFTLLACDPNHGAEPCGAYAEALCAKLGEDQGGCEAVKSTLKLVPPVACEQGLDDLAFTDGSLAKMREACTGLVTKLCADLGPDSESCGMVREQTPKFPAGRCDALLAKYDLVLADLKKREEANKPLSAEMQTTLASAQDVVFGPAGAKVTLIEFSDFECPYCSAAADAVGQVKKKYGDKVRFVFRHFPLSFHPNAHLAAQAAMAAAEQGKFWELHDLLFKNQKALDRASIEKYAGEVGLNVGKLKAALDSKKFAGRVDQDVKLGGDVGVEGTPTMFLNGARVANPTDFAALSALIDKALAAGG